MCSGRLKDYRWCLRDGRGVGSVIRSRVRLTRDTAQGVGDPAYRHRFEKLRILP